MYELKPEYAGRLLECPACGRHLRAGPPPGTSRPAALQVDPAFDREVFLLRERVLTIRSKYEVWAEDGTPVLYVERPTYPLRTLVARRLHPVVLAPLPAEQAARVRRLHWLVAAMLVYTVWGWMGS